MTDDPSIWKQLAGWLWGILVPVGAWAWNAMNKRLERIETELDAKADAKEFDRQKDNIAKLFDQQADMRQDMHKGFSDLKDIVHRGFLEVTKEISRKADK